MHSPDQSTLRMLCGRECGFGFFLLSFHSKLSFPSNAKRQQSTEVLSHDEDERAERSESNALAAILYAGLSQPITIWMNLARENKKDHVIHQVLYVSLHYFRHE